MDSSESDKIESQNQASTATEPTQNFPQTEETLGLEMMSFGGNTYIATSILAEKFGYDGDHIARLARQGKVESIKQGKRWYIARESLEEYRRKADENKRVAASESVKSARRAIREAISRGPKIAPSLALFQIAEHVRVSWVSLRPLFNNNGFKLILLALFIFSLSWLSISRDISTNIDDEHQTAGILSTIQNTLKFLFEPALEGIYDEKLENKLAELEDDINEIQVNIYSGQKTVIRETVREVTGTSIPVSPPRDIQARLSVLEDFYKYGQDKFQSIDERFLRTPTILVTTSNTSLPTTATILNPYTIDSNTVKAQTLTVLGSGTVANDFTISGTASASKIFGAGLSDCDAAADTLNWDASTGKFSCGTDSGAGAAEIKVEKDGATVLATATTLNFDDGKFNVTASGASEVSINLDWTSAGGPASLSQNETVTGFWNFSNGASFTINIEAAGYASASKYFGAGLTDCDAETQTLNWSADNGRFSCLADATGGGGGALIEVKDVPGIYNNNVSSLSFDGGKFTITSSGSVALVNLDWGTGPASLSQNETVLGFWVFDAGASVSTNLEVEGPASISGKLTINNHASSSGTVEATTLKAGTYTGDSTVSINTGTGDLTLDANSNNVIISANASVSGVFEIGSNDLYVNTSGIGVNTQNLVEALEVVGVGSISSELNVFGGLEVSKGTAADVAYSRLGTAGTSYASLISAADDLLITGSLETDDKSFFDSTVSISGKFELSADASSSSDFEFGGYASASQYFGAGLSACNGDTQTLAWVSGLFSCGDDDSTIKVEKSGTQELAAASILNFDDGKFDVTASGTTETIINLDWVSAGGPASLSQNETVLGFWVFNNGASFATSFEVESAASISGQLTINNHASSSGTIEATTLKAGTITGDTAVSINTGAGDLTLDSFNNNVIISANASTSGILEIGSNKLYVDTSNSRVGINTQNLTETLEIVGTASISSEVNIFGGLEVAKGTAADVVYSRFGSDATDVPAYITTADDLRISGDMDVVGTGSFNYASVSQGYFGGGLTDCDTAATSKLLWNADNGRFSCGTDQSGGGGGATPITVQTYPGGTRLQGRVSLSFDNSAFDIVSSGAGDVRISLDYTNGPASRAIDQTITGLWEFRNGASFSGPVSVSGGFEVRNGGYASASKYFGGGLTDCDNTGAQYLAWTASGSAEGKFSCKTLTRPNNIKYASSSVSITRDLTEQSLNINVTITPNRADSDILIMGFVRSTGGGATDNDETVKIRQGNNSTSRLIGLTACGHSDTISISCAFTFVDRPGAVASAVTYSVWEQSEVDAVGTVTDRSITIMEVEANGADLAEFYGTMDTSISIGDVVSIDPGIINGIQKSVLAYDKNVLGVVSTRPALIMGGGGYGGISTIPVALAGRVPVKVTIENGQIKPGDYLTSSAIPGVAMKATKAGPVIGQALSGFDGEGIGVVTVFVRSGYFNGTALADNDPEENQDSKDILTSLISHAQNSSNSFGSEINTDRIAAGLEIITPKIITQGVIADKIIAQTISAPASSSLVFEGDADFSGLIKVNKIIAQEIESPMLAELITQVALFASASDGINSRLAGLESQREIDIKEILALEGGLTVQGLTTLNGALEVSEIRSADEYIAFTTDTMFFGRPIFNNDAGGFATILQGEKRVEIKYEKEYLEKPVVNLTIKSDADGRIFPESIDYVLTDEGTKGFAVILNKPAPFDIEFNWTALAVKDPKTFFSIKTPAIIEVKPQSSPEATPIDSIEVEPLPSLEVQPLPSPEPTPELTPSSSPAVSESPASTISPQAAPSPSTTPEPAPEITPEVQPPLEVEPPSESSTSEPTEELTETPNQI